MFLQCGRGSYVSFIRDRPAMEQPKANEIRRSPLVEPGQLAPGRSDCSGTSCYINSMLQAQVWTILLSIELEI